MRLPDIDLPEKFDILWRVCSARQWTHRAGDCRTLMKTWSTASGTVVPFLVLCRFSDSRNAMTYLLTYILTGLLPYTVNLNNHSTSVNDISRPVIEFQSTSRKTDLLTRTVSIQDAIVAAMVAAIIVYNVIKSLTTARCLLASTFFNRLLFFYLSRGITISCVFNCGVICIILHYNGDSLWRFLLQKWSPATTA